MNRWTKTGKGCLVLVLMALAGCGGQAAGPSTSGPNPPSQSSPTGNPSPPAESPTQPTGTPSPPPGQPNPPPPSANPVLANHVVIVVLENEGYAEVIGSPEMPYLNSLANRFSLAANFFADTHPSIGNYFMLTTGQIITNNDSFSGIVDVDNIVRELGSAGESWKCYAESLPSVGYLGGDKLPYVKRHNPFAYLSDVINNPAQAGNLVPFTQFAQDLALNQLPNYSFVVPNQQHNAHDCPGGSSTGCTESDKLLAADTWLQANIDPLLQNPGFQQSGILVITWDEATSADNSNGGGHIAVVLAGPKVKTAFQSSTFFQHESVLRLSMEALGLNRFPGKSANAAAMDEFFQ